MLVLSSYKIWVTARNTDIPYLSVNVQYTQQVSNTNTCIFPVVIQEIHRIIQVYHYPMVGFYKPGVSVPEIIFTVWNNPVMMSSGLLNSPLV